MTSRPILVLVGPTAAGKSELALALAEDAGGEIVSADSVQVYRGLDIGSAKPTAAERARVPHHALDLISPEERIDAARWAEVADAAIAVASGPVLVAGGTGLYVRALLHGLSPAPATEPPIRAAVAEELRSLGPEALHASLRAVDPEAAARIPPTDPQRLTRALEVFRQTGRPLSAWQADHGFSPRRHDARVVGLWPDRVVLAARIASRVDAMLRRGWVEEVEALLSTGVPPDAPGLRTLGYRDVVRRLRGEVSAADLPAVLATAHRRYAKRQLTWFRGVTAKDDPFLHLDPTEPSTPANLRRLLAREAP